MDAKGTSTTAAAINVANVHANSAHMGKRGAGTAIVATDTTTTVQQPCHVSLITYIHAYMRAQKLMHDCSCSKAERYHLPDSRVKAAMCVLMISRYTVSN